MYEISGYSNLMMNGLLVNNLLVNPPSSNSYSSYNDMLVNALTYEYDDPFAEDYNVDISPEARQMSLVYGTLSGNSTSLYDSVPDMLNSNYIALYGDNLNVEIK